jgi:hypothetical protein
LFISIVFVSIGQIFFLGAKIRNFFQNAKTFRNFPGKRANEGRGLMKEEGRG